MNHPQETHAVEEPKSHNGRFPNQEQRKFILGGSLIALTLIGMLGVGLYVNLTKTPEDALARVQENFLKVKTFEYVSKTTLKVVSDGPAEIDSKSPYAAFTDGVATITLAGKTDLTSQNPDSESSFELTSQSSAAKDFSIKGETKYVDDIFYARLLQLSVGGILPAELADGSWIRFDLKALRAAGKTNYDTKEAQIADQKIREAFKEARVISVINKLPDATIEGKATYHYRLPVDKAGLESFIKKTQAILYPEQKESDLAERAEYYLQMLDEIEIEAWVGKKDLLPYKIAVTNTIKDPSIPSAKLEVRTEITLSNYNKTFVVKAPDETITLEAFMQKLYGQNPDTPPGNPRLPAGSATQGTTSSDSDRDGLSDEKERLYGTNPLIKDTDNDGFDDFQEIMTGHNPLESAKTPPTKNLR